MDKERRAHVAYDMQHRPIDVLAAGALLGDAARRRIAATTVAQRWYISTVFLVTDHDASAPAPVLYETRVFDQTARETMEEYTERYFTTVAALAGHDQIVAELHYLAAITA